MNIRYLFSSPEGDVPATRATLEGPFLVAPSKAHPSLTLGDYFGGMARFVGKNRARILTDAIRMTSGDEAAVEDILEVLIRSEKHGALYHIARVEVILPEKRFPFALVSALSSEAKACLHREFETLRRLKSDMGGPFLPHVFSKEEVRVDGDHESETMVMVLQEWLEDYHEWHLSLDQGGRRSTILWDLNRGYRNLTREETVALFHQAALILTRHYDTRTFHRIHPWYHGAGDFVLRLRGGVPEVKLTTVRGYEPLLVFQEEREANPWTALVFFFLGLTIRMRIDRLDGLGELVWAEDFVVKATLTGFFQGLACLAKENRFSLGDPADALSLLKTFSEEELLRLAEVLLDHYRISSPQEYPLIRTQLESHIRCVRDNILALNQ